MDITGYWVKDLSIEPITSAAMQCRASILRSCAAANESQGKLKCVLPMASSRRNNIIIFFLNFASFSFWDERIKERKGNCHQYRIISF